jgi:hypothetical protein
MADAEGVPVARRLWGAPAFWRGAAERAELLAGPAAAAVGAGAEGSR